MTSNPHFTARSDRNRERYRTVDAIAYTAVLFAAALMLVVLMVR